MSLPSTDLEVKIVLPIPVRRSVLRSRSRCIQLGAYLKGSKNDDETTQYEIHPKMSGYVRQCILTNRLGFAGPPAADYGFTRSSRSDQSARRRQRARPMLR